MTTWEPTAEDIAWQTNMVRVLTNNAEWVVPCSLSSFKIDKINKVVSLTLGDESDEQNQRVIKVFAKMGYTFGQKKKHPWEK